MEEGGRGGGGKGGRRDLREKSDEGFERSFVLLGTLCSCQPRALLLSSH